MTVSWLGMASVAFRDALVVLRGKRLLDRILAKSETLPPASGVSASAAWPGLKTWIRDEE